MNLEALQKWLFDSLGRRVSIDSACPVSGGCINEAWLVQDDQKKHIFVKNNDAVQIKLFETEIESLKLLGSANAIRVPEPYACGVIDGRAVLAMEGLILAIVTDVNDQKSLGRKIAALHGTSSPSGQFGADFDNYIGATPQLNKWEDSWTDFFIEQRLNYQFDLAERKGRTYRRRSRFIDATRKFLDNCEVEPSLLHGDLWSGNVSFDRDGEPVTYDPAAYFGDRETDIAFTHMFGGFSPAFYQTYRETFPEPEEISIRHRIYNLYHLLNHFNLFGGGYGDQAGESIRKTLKELK